MAVVAPIVSTFIPKGVLDAEKAFKKLGKQLQGALGVAAFAQFTRGAILAAEEGQKSAARLEQVARSMNLFGTETARVTDRLITYADTLARTTGVDDDVIKLTQAKLLTFRNLAETADVVGGSFDRATQAALDLAATGFGSAESTAVALGKALQDPVGGITALRKAGVTFTAEQKKLIAELVASNRVLEAQNVILAAVESQVGGTAAATATSSDKLRVAFDQVQESVGNALLPAFQDLVNTLLPVLKAFESAPPELSRMLIGTIALVYGLKKLNAVFTALKVSASTANAALGALALATELYLAFAGDGIDDLKASMNNFTDAIMKGTDEQVLLADAALKFKATQKDVDYARAYYELADGSITAARRLLALKVAAGAPQSEIEALAQAIRKVTLESAQADKTTKDYAGSASDAATDIATERVENDKLVRSLRNVQDQYLDALDAKLGYFSDDLNIAAANRSVFRALEDVQDIQQEIADGKFDGTLLDIADASDRFVEAALQSADAVSTLAQEQGNGQLATQQQVTELKRIRDLLAPTDPLRKRLDDYIQQLLKIPESILTTIGIQFPGVGQPDRPGFAGPGTSPSTTPTSTIRQNAINQARNGDVYTINVNGALDAASTARQVRELLQQDGKRLGLKTPVPAI